MDTGYYSKKTIEEFIKKNLCQDDKLLYKYYQNVDVHKFRSRLSKFRDIDDNISKVVQTCITDMTRDVIINIVEELTLFMKPFGDLIISGGAAFNAYFDTENRIITTDIDTKFTPIFKFGKTLINSKDPKFFGLLQVAKLLIWNKLGQVVTKYNHIICKRIKTYIIGSQIGKLLGISFIKDTRLKRRYTLIKKDKDKNVLIDIELFAIDIELKYFVPSEKKVSNHNIGGILDIAFMRPSEFGYEATYTKGAGIYVGDISTGKLKYKKNILIASPKFLIDDLYYLQKFNLRPDKKSKDRERMYIFSRYALNVTGIKPKDSLESIYNKSKNKAKSTRTNLLDRPKFTAQHIIKAIHVNPYRYGNVTTLPEYKKVIKQLFYGIKGGNKLNIPGYYPTHSNMRFVPNKGTWIKNNNPTYIHNEANYRPNTITQKTNVKLLDILYGYNPARDSWMPTRVLAKSAIIPVVGLKKNPVYYT